MNYAWPGNVRELAHELERAIVFGGDGELDLAHLTGPAVPDGAAPVAAPAEPFRWPPEEWFNPEFVFPDQGFSLEAATDRIVQHALRQTEGNVSAAARLLGVSRDVVRYRLSGKRVQGAGAGEPANAGDGTGTSAGE